MDDGMMIAVLTVDISRSREFEGRGALQVRMNEAIGEVNSRYGDGLVAGFSITLGDEFQGAVKDVKLCYKMFIDFEDLFYPVRIKGGIGLGRLETPVSDRVVEMDGSAFYRSREALKKAKDSGASVVVVSGDVEFDAAINTLLELLGIIRNRWTKRQREIVTYLRGKDMTLEEVGGRFGVTKQNISQIIEKTSFEAVSKAENQVSQTLGKVKTLDK